MRATSFLFLFLSFFSLSFAIPTLSELVITPAAPTPSDTIDCEMSATTNATNMSAYTTWHKNGYTQYTLTTNITTGNATDLLISQVSPIELQVGDVWHCRLTLCDSEGCLAPAESLQVKVIENDGGKEAIVFLAMLLFGVVFILVGMRMIQWI